MEDLQKLETNQLVDLLARRTAHYTTLLSTSGISKETNECKRVIELLQKEIRKRQKERAGREKMRAG